MTVCPGERHPSGTLLLPERDWTQAEKVTAGLSLEDRFCARSESEHLQESIHQASPGTPTKWDSRPSRHPPSPANWAVAWGKLRINPLTQIIDSLYTDYSINRIQDPSLRGSGCNG